MEIEVFQQAAIKLIGNIIIYFDPYNIKEEYHDADYIFITHDHYDHYDEESISKIKKDNTKIIVPECLKEKTNDLVVQPNKKYTIDNVVFDTIPSYNIDKSFHPKEANYVGYRILLNGLYYYIMGDTDRTPEADSIKTDYCFVPIGGVYTMNVEEAIHYINDLNPKCAIPIHYGSIVGDKSLGQKFKTEVNDNIEVKVFI